MVSVRSEGGTTVDAMDMVRDWAMLPWLVFLVLLPGPTLTGGGEPAGACSSGEASVPPDSLRRLGMTLPLIVCAYSLSLEYELMDMVRSSGRSGTTRP